MKWENEERREILEKMVGMKEEEKDEGKKRNDVIVWKEKEIK